MTNISVTLDDTFFWAYESYEAGEGLRDGLGEPPEGYNWHTWAREVYDAALSHMLKLRRAWIHGGPRRQARRGSAQRLHRNHIGRRLRRVQPRLVGACQRFTTPEQFGAAVRDAALFLTAGSVYSEVPYEKVAEVRDKNRRLGLGLIGVHEFLIKRGLRYGTDDAFEALEPYM